MTTSVLQPILDQAFERPLVPSLRSAVAPFIAMDVMSTARRLERAGRDIVHMEVGEPAAPTPNAAREAARVALDGGRIGYTEALGRPSLRERIARHYRETYGVTLSADRIVVTTGSSGGFLLAFLGLFDVGARIAIASPGYPAYHNIFDALGLETVMLETSACRPVISAAMIEAAHARQRLDGVMLTSPNNPTGTMIGADELRDVCETCDRLGIIFISDEIYHGLTYLGPAETALRFSDRAVVANSFSKFYCMTGWRVGWLVLPAALVRTVERLQQNFAVSVPYLSQVAAEAVFDATDELEAIRRGYARNRDILLDTLPRLGLGDFYPPDGAFYLYVDVSRFTEDSMAFCQRMLAEAGIAATPGLDFDRAHGQYAVRLSFAGSEASIVEAVRRLENWLR